MVHGKLSVVWDGAALVATYIAAVTPSCDLPGLQSGRQGVERPMDRGTGGPACCVPSNPCGIGKLRFRVDGFVSGGVPTLGVPRLLPVPGARRLPLVLDGIRACCRFGDAIEGDSGYIPLGAGRVRDAARTPVGPATMGETIGLDASVFRRGRSLCRREDAAIWPGSWARTGNGPPHPAVGCSSGSSDVPPQSAVACPIEFFLSGRMECTVDIRQGPCGCSHPRRRSISVEALRTTARHAIAAIVDGNSVRDSGGQRSCPPKARLGA